MIPAACHSLKNGGQAHDLRKRLYEIAAYIESTESSNRIEGIEAPRLQLEKIVLHGAKPRNRSEQEIAGYRDALALIHDSAPAMPLSTNLILQLHQTVFRYLPSDGGQWKSTDNEIVERLADGTQRLRFRPVPSIATPQAMGDLVAGWHQALLAPASDALVLTPLLVLDFLCIHPFRDGNGRVGRLLTLLALYQVGYEVGRYISLERVIVGLCPLHQSDRLGDQLEFTGCGRQPGVVFHMPSETPAKKRI